MELNGFQFVGEALAFDFVNTDVVVRRKPLDLLATPEDLRRWWHTALSHYQMNAPELAQATSATLAKAKTLRGALHRIFESLVQQIPFAAQDVDLLNDLLRSGHTQLVALPDQRFGIQQISSETDTVFLAIAQSAIWLLTECDRDRLHKCKNEHCVLLFLDTTKNANRVWCSTDCMNRARSSERYATHKH